MACARIQRGIIQAMKGCRKVTLRTLCRRSMLRGLAHGSSSPGRGLWFIFVVEGMLSWGKGKECWDDNFELNGR